MIEKYSFENFMMQCCKAKEWKLRSFLKKRLIEAGFDIIEDDYTSHRGGNYDKVHNMLAIRGNPRICLVAHTDVCRDHVDDSVPVVPAIKTMSIDGEIKRVLQEKDCANQIGGDDRVGVSIANWIALNTGYDLAILMTTDEEIGVVSAEYARFPQLLEFDLLVQIDRGNHSHQLVNRISGRDLCSDQTAARLIKISEDIGLPRYIVNGFLTDVLAIKSNHMCKEAVNMTCGYHDSLGPSKTEYIDIQEAKDTMKYVSSIIQYYDLDKDKEEPEYIEETKYIDEDDEFEQYILNEIKENEELFSERRYNKEKSYFDDEYREINFDFDF